MRILTIETCTDTSTLGLLQDGVLLAEAAFPSRHTLARRLFTRLDWLLAESGLQKQALEAIAVSLGPGSFTGVRIGLAAAKTLALGLGIPLVGIPTLEALAYPLRGLRDAVLAPVINARRQQAYLAVFNGVDGVLQRRTPDLVLSASDFARTLRDYQTGMTHTLLIGQLDGLPPGFFAEAPASITSMRSLVTPHALAVLAAERLARGAVDDPMTLTPIYLRNAAD